MTILVDVGERNWPAQDNAFAFSVDAAATRLRVSLEHPDWPEGECVRMDVTWPGGTTGTHSTGGGIVRDKAGNPTGGTMISGWTCYKPPGVTSGMARVQTTQALRSAVRVESL